ncbi:outer membrane protein assembly factor BamB family protein [Actinophytocola sediminis]
MSQVSRCFVCLIMVALMVSACTGDPATSPPDSGPAKFVVSPEPVWTAPAGLSAGRLPELREDSLIVYGAGADAGGNRAVAVLDIATGEPRWSVDSQITAGPDRGRQEKVADAGNGEWVVIAPYECAASTDCAPGNGIVAFDGKDGRTRWRTPLDANLRVGFIAVGGDVAVSLVGASDEKLGGSRAVATDVSDGSVRWESVGVWPLFVVADTVLGIETDRLRPLDPTVESASTVVGLDARTGARRWDLSDRYPRSNLQLALGDVAVVGTADERGGNQRSRVVDARTGSELADLGEPMRCLGDQQSLVVCGPVTGRDLTLFDVDSREKSVLRGAKPQGSTGILSPQRGYLFRGEDVIDRTGAVVSDKPLGFVMAMSDRYLVTRSGEAGDEIAGYRIEKQ